MPKNRVGNRSTFDLYPTDPMLDCREESLLGAFRLWSIQVTFVLRSAIVYTYVIILGNIISVVKYFSINNIHTYLSTNISNYLIGQQQIPYHKFSALWKLKGHRIGHDLTDTRTKLLPIFSFIHGTVPAAWKKSLSGFSPGFAGFSRSLVEKPIQHTARTMDRIDKYTELWIWAFFHLNTELWTTDYSVVIFLCPLFYGIFALHVHPRQRDHVRKDSFIEDICCSVSFIPKITNSNKILLSFISLKRYPVIRL